MAAEVVSGTPTQDERERVKRRWRRGEMRGKFVQGGTEERRI